MSRWEQHLAERSRNLPSTRRWADNYDRLGMLGEKALAEFFEAEQDLRYKPAGDNGIDLETLLNLEPPLWEWYEIDAKASDTPGHLLVEKYGKHPIKARRIYVLVGVEYDDTAECLGWETGRDLMREPAKPWAPGRPIVHYKAAQRLQPMDNLRHAYQGWWRWHGCEARPAIKAAIVNSFHGACHCGAPGLYWTPQAWFCNEHRP